MGIAYAPDPNPGRLGQLIDVVRGDASAQIKPWRQAYFFLMCLSGLLDV